MLPQCCWVHKSAPLAADDAVPGLGYWSESELQKKIRCPFCDKGTEDRFGPIVVEAGKPGAVAWLPLELATSAVVPPFGAGPGPASCIAEALFRLSRRVESHMVEASSESESTGTGASDGLPELQQPLCELCEEGWPNDDVEEDVSSCLEGARVLAPSPEKELSSRKALLLPRPAADPAPSTTVEPGPVTSMLGARALSTPAPASIAPPSKEGPDGSEEFGSRLAVQLEDEDDEQEGLAGHWGWHPEKGKKLLLPQNSSGTSGTGSAGDGHSAKK